MYPTLLPFTRPTGAPADAKRDHSRGPPLPALTANHQLSPLSAPCRNRTYNLVIKSHLLCQLS